MSIKDSVGVVKEALASYRNGQWSLKKTLIPAEESLSKTDEETSKNHHKDISKARLGHKKMREKNKSSVETLMKMVTSGDASKNAKGLAMLRKFVLKAPKGSVDLHHLMGQGKLKHDQRDEFLSHHLGDSKSLKDIYDNHGEDTLKTLMDNMGANGTPHEYGGLKFKDPRVHHELNDIMNPRTSKGESDARTMGTKNYAANSYRDHMHADHNDNVNDTYNEMYEHEYGDNAQGQSTTQLHDDSAVERGMHAFKSYHGLNAPTEPEA